MSQVISAAYMQSITAEFANPATIPTDPIRVNGANYVHIFVKVPHIFGIWGAPSLVWKVQNSNNGEDWLDETGLFGTAVTPGDFQISGDVTAAFIRLVYDVSVGAQGGDWGSTCFNVKINLMQK